MSKERLEPALLRLCGILAVGAFAPLLDSTIVSVAVDALGRDFGVSTAGVQWVSTAYLLAFALVMPVSGWAGDRFGTRRVWLGALVLFLVGSVLCAFAGSVVSLVLFRGVQGAGGGLMLPVLQTIIVRACGGQRVGRLMAVVSLPALLGPVLGPVVGGLLIGHLGWRWIFYVNVPVCVLALFLAWRGVPHDRALRASRLDVVGLVLVCPGLTALVYGLSQVGGQVGFGRARVLVPMAAGAVLVAAFVGRSMRAEAPLIDVRLFRLRSFAATSVLMFVGGLTMYGGMFLLPLYYQLVLGKGVVATGLLLASQGAGALSARVAGVVADKVGPRPVVVTGLLLSAAGTWPFVVPVSDGPIVCVALFLRGFGMSAANLAVMVGAYEGLDDVRVSDASTTTRIVQQLGGSFGTAALAVLLQHGGHTPAAFAHAFRWTVVLTVLAVVVAALLPGRRTVHVLPLAAGDSTR
ncbi:DHA2 family efflux MFS transporter permease subunit [Streptomyces sp. NRRL B-24572]|uniref:DHA2 family efflux MFS transporter permease subunit n=1 Tax=Streptomyces sp. NRRL B-24572 TaxID=1962156 RepID=UPI000A369CFC|nr:DHA2 family efflux MFS transporter permease subunit [Streptomyces sp. NRRL B-24572]